MVSSENKEFEIIGKPVPRIESIPKVTGTIKYCDDIYLPGMLYAKFLRCPHPHARILKINTEKALKLQGVKLVLTPEDIKGLPPIGIVAPENKYVLTDHPRYVGDEVAAVAAIDEETCERALDLIEIEYELLPFVMDPFDSMKPGAPQIHDWEKNNICDRRKLRAGDVKKGFKDADFIFKDTFKTSKQAHVCMECHSAIANYEPFSGQLTVWTDTQKNCFIRDTLSFMFHIPSSKVRVMNPEGFGSGFGGKDEIFPHQIITTLMSIKLAKPVKMVYSREEVFMATRTRHPFIREIEVGLKKDGKIVAWKEKITMDCGAYRGYGQWVCLLSQIMTGGPYKIDNIQIDSDIVYTNKSPSGAFRGFGNPQGTFVRESILNRAAREMGMDYKELMLKNTIKQNDLPYTNSRGQIIRSCGIDECIKKAAKAIGWDKKRKKNTGIGIAGTYHWSSAKNLTNCDFAAIIINLNPDGSAIVHCGSVDYGQGLYTVIVQIVAEGLGIPVEMVKIIGNDTENTPYSIGVWGCRGALVEGSAAKYATDDIRRQIFEGASKFMGLPQDDLFLKNQKVCSKSNSKKSMLLRDAAYELHFNGVDKLGGKPIIGQGIWRSDTTPFDLNGIANPIPAYGFGVHAAEVEVDTETGKIKIINYVIAHDVGRALNLAIVEGQLQGGVAHGIGYGLFEETYYDDKTGQPANPFFIDYKVPSAEDVPNIEPIIIETIDPAIPLGNKGVGEFSLVCAAPALANAIFDAVGVRIKELPITSEKVLKALKERKKLENLKKSI
jgi:CO/xanthine dehydrogenase Mo-binding subunit